MAVNFKKGTSKTTIPVKGKTEVTHQKTGADVTKEELLFNAEVDPVHATIGVTAQRTINLGEYNSVKLGVSIYMPCKPTKPAVDTAYDQCVAWVDEKMQALCAEHDTPVED